MFIMEHERNSIYFKENLNEKAGDSKKIALNDS